MALDVHGVVTSMVAPQHLAAGAERNDDAAASARAAVVRASAKYIDGANEADTVDLKSARFYRLPAAFPDIQRALAAAFMTATAITERPAAAFEAQANSQPDQVFELVQ